MFKNNVMVREDKHWREPEGLKKTKKYKMSNQTVKQYEKLKPIPEKVKRTNKKSF